MDFGTLSPEINSARMYAGAGSAPMLAAAAAWDGLAAELHGTAVSYSAVISGLGDSWSGPSSEAMAAAAAPYVTWMNATAAQAEQSANQARAAAAAYEAAFAMTVPPPVIAVNRSLLTVLTATNFLGQDTAAIAAIQAEYAEMWAQDTAAMYGYAGDSAAASRLTPFASPPPTTNPGGLAGQANGVQATGASAATTSQSLLSQLTSQMPQTLQGMASPVSSASPAPATSGASAMPGAFPRLSLGNGSIFGPSSPGSAASLRQVAPIGSSIPMPLASISKSLTTGAAAQGVPAMLEALLNWLGSGSGAAGSAGPARVSAPGSGNPTGPGDAAVSADLGRATRIGPLSVPKTWTAPSPPSTAASGRFLSNGLRPIWETDADPATGVAFPYGLHPAVLAHPPAAG